MTCNFVVVAFSNNFRLLSLTQKKGFYMTFYIGTKVFIFYVVFARFVHSTCITCYLCWISDADDIVYVMYDNLFISLYRSGVVIHPSMNVIDARENYFAAPSIIHTLALRYLNSSSNCTMIFEFKILQNNKLISFLKIVRYISHYIINIL